MDDPKVAMDDPKMEPEDGAERHIPAGSLRLDAAVAAELFGWVFHEVTTNGPAAFGDHNQVTNVIIGGADPAKPHLRRITNLDLMQSSYAVAPTDHELERMLSNSHAVCLTGIPGTGRFTTASVMLARLHGTSKVNEILLPPGMDLSTLHRHTEAILEKEGHLLRVPSAVSAELMRLLDAAAGSRNARVILIQDLDHRLGDRHSAEVRHAHAPPVEVFRCQLTSRLSIMDAFAGDEAVATAYVEALLRSEALNGAIHETRRPRETVELAYAIAQRLPAPDDLADVLAASQPCRRVLASQAMAAVTRPNALRHRRLEQHGRAFRIAYTVFHRQPMNHVFEATGWLLEQIDRGSGRDDLGRAVLEHCVADLLGEVLASDWMTALQEDPGSAARTARLRDPAMRGALLDVAWHEFDNSRPALMKWLDRMAQCDDEVRRRAAAEVAGLLAHLDFEPIFEALVDGWAASSRASVRQAAAWTAATAALGGQIGHRILERVRMWARSGMSRQHDTAARIYASGLHQPTLAWTLADLRYIAGDKMQKGNAVIAEAVYQAYQPGNAAYLVAELARWIREGDTHVHAHAARSLLALAASAAETSTEQPELLVRLAAAEIDHDDIATVLRTALLDPGLARRAWDVFEYWLRAADTSIELRKPMADLTRTFAADRVTRRRLRFYLSRGWHPDAVPDWLTEAMREDHHA